MAVTIESQVGKAVISGVRPNADGTPGTATNTADTVGGALSAAISGNVQSSKGSEEWDEREIISQDGATVETIVSYKRRRSLSLKVIPNGTLRSDAQAIIDHIRAMGPNCQITLAAFKDAWINGTWNYKSGGSIEYSAEGYVVADISIMQYMKVSDGSFAALAAVTA